MDRLSRVPPTFLVLALLVPIAPAQAPPPGVPFEDTLFASVDAAWRATFDEEGDVWYTSEGGLVHVDVRAGTREVFTRMEGLPSSYSMGLAMGDGKAYVATDGGLGIIDLASGDVRSVTRENSPLRARSLHDVALDGDDVWLGTRTSGVARWNTTTDAWTFHNTTTTASPPWPVQRVLATASSVWVATDGDGLWRMDRATGAWSVRLVEDGLPSNKVHALLEHDGLLWVGTEAGLARLDPSTGETRVFDRRHGLPHARVTDLDLIPNAEGTLDLWASTPRGLWQHDLVTGAAEARNVGFHGTYVLSNEWSEAHGWLVATERGVSHYHGDAWRRYPTNPFPGPANGPFTTRITAVGSGESGPYLWFGTHLGLAAYQRPTQTKPGVWYNLGPAQHYPGSVVNAIDTEGNTTWLATNNGTFGYNRESNTWISRVIEGTRNLVYGVDADRDELWIPFFGEGLLAQDVNTGATRTWNYQTTIPIPDVNLLDVRVQGDDVWVGSARGLLRLDRLTGAVQGFWTRADGIPGGTVYRVLPDGPVVWLGTKEGGVARFDVAQGRVTQVWNGTTTPGFVYQDVRALHREGNRLWAGTVGGLWRLDLATQRDRVFNASNSGLVQDFVQGIASADGLLYLATFSGVARMDLATEAFLPMRDGAGVVRGTPPATLDEDPHVVSKVSVRIASPRDGAYVAAGPVTLKGTAARFGGRVDAVEVRVADGPWTPAAGTHEWSYVWDASGATPETPVLVQARARAGNETSFVEQVTLTPIVSPSVPLAIEDVSPTEGHAGQPFPVLARVQGDAPLSATLLYRMEGAASWTRAEMTRSGGFFEAEVPGRDVREGTLLYVVEARSGRLALTSPEDPEAPARVAIAPAPATALRLSGPASWRAEAGQASRIPLLVENVGTEPVSFHLRASGLRAPWIRLDEADHTLRAGENVTIEALLTVPARAFSDRTSLTFEASGLTLTETLAVPLEVVGAPEDTPLPTPSGGRVPIPTPLLALAAGALLARRRVP